MKRACFLSGLFVMGVLVLLSSVVSAEENSSTNQTLSCKDSDGGLNYYTKGSTIEGGDAIAIDNCNGSILMENYCNDDGRSKYVSYECKYGCKEGACVSLACGIPTCAGVYNTGKIDERGCAVYTCPSVACSKPVCEGVYDTGKKDANECPIYACHSNASRGDFNLCLDDSDNYWDQETNTCYPGFSSVIIKKLCFDPDEGINKYQVAHTFGFRSVYADSRDKRIRTGGKDGCINANTLVEIYCDDSGFIQTTYLEVRKNPVHL